VYIRIPLPTLTSELVSNLLGLAGLAGVVIAVGGLTGNAWWSLLAGSVLLVGLSYVAHAGAPARPASEPARGPAGARPRRAA
jgi:hypothetical protein